MESFFSLKFLENKAQLFNNRDWKFSVVGFFNSWDSETEILRRKPYSHWRCLTHFRRQDFPVNTFPTSFSLKPILMTIYCCFPGSSQLFPWAWKVLNTSMGFNCASSEEDHFTNTYQKWQTTFIIRRVTAALIKLDLLPLQSQVGLHVLYPNTIWVKLACQNIAPILIKVYDSCNKHFGSRQVQHNTAPGRLMKIHTRLFSSLKAGFLLAIQTNISGNQLRAFCRCVRLIMITSVYWCANSTYYLESAERLASNISVWLLFPTV